MSVLEPALKNVKISDYNGGRTMSSKVKEFLESQ